MYKIGFIIPYIGKFPNYFQLWLNSCSYNNTIDWIVFTDDTTKYNYPSNVHVYYTSFSCLKSKFQSNFDFEISLERPYRFCDFKPSYGEVFAEYLKDYDFWGYCDVDLIWGNLRKWLTDEVLFKYKRISTFGHCYILKNEPEINKLYKTQIEGFYGYRIALRNNMEFGFDENLGVNKIYDRIGLVPYQLPFFDVSVPYLKFTPTQYSKQFINYNTSNNIFHISPLKVELMGYYNGQLIIKEFAYVHLQKRNMKIDIPQYFDSYLIIPNKFTENFIITQENIKSKTDKGSFQYYNKKIMLNRMKRILGLTKVRYYHDNLMKFSEIIRLKKQQILK